MDGAFRHGGDKLKKWENIVPLFQPPYSPEVNPVESLRHHIREKGEIQEYYFSQPKGGRKKIGTSNKHSIINADYQ
ncbi:hypothetical protein EZS27_007991 [termite gut metagenome]|uniref:Tc1-like transposase DDE domain-containing protein n=1 Tax=termite gut metagenome TaxID=433724 RepID=A0A5J4SF41_9ZZZZ